MFEIKKVRPLFTGVVTTAKKYIGEMKTAGGILLDATRMDGELNCYQTVVAVGNMCKDVQVGDIVKVNFKRYAKSKHTPGRIDESTNTQMDKMSLVYEIPIININGAEHLFLQTNDIEYVVEEFDVDEGGLLQ